MKVLVTGSAGFIGFHLAQRLLDLGYEVFGLDNFSDYYDVELKYSRHALLSRSPRFSFTQAALESDNVMETVLARVRPDIVVHLAAQAGVRYSIDHPDSYVSSNLVGTFRLLESVRHFRPRHLLIASTSSVYGANEVSPSRETDRTDFPQSLYAATKKACEAMAHSYSNLYGVSTTCFRFFTVYGPWGRPDMALFKFVEAVMRDQPIEVYGYGEMQRDFTYVSDLVDCVVALMDVVPSVGSSSGQGDSLSPVAPFRTVNIAGSEPRGLLDLIHAIESALAKKAVMRLVPMQPGDVVSTHADSSLLFDLIGRRPETPLEDGVAEFVSWYRERYNSG